MRNRQFQSTSAKMVICKDGCQRRCLKRMFEGTRTSRHTGTIGEGQGMWKVRIGMPRPPFTAYATRSERIWTLRPPFMAPIVIQLVGLLPLYFVLSRLCIDNSASNFVSYHLRSQDHFFHWCIRHIVRNWRWKDSKKIIHIKVRYPRFEPRSHKLEVHE